MLVNVMKMAAMELIIVTESGLGSINSAALTVSYGKNNGTIDQRNDYEPLR